MTDTAPENANPFDTEEYAQHVRDCIARRDVWKAELADSITKAKAALVDVKRLANELSGDSYLDYADGDDWLNGDDLGVFDALWENAAMSVAALVAINRPHPGDPLWPKIVPGNTGEHVEYAVECTTAQDLADPGARGLETLPPHYIGPFDTEFLARYKGTTLHANGHVLTATVKARKHPAATGWVDPAEFKNDDE